VGLVRDVMRTEVDVLAASESVTTAARHLAARTSDSVTVCAADGEVAGTVSSRDIVTRVVATGRDPERVLLGELLGSGPALFVEAGASVDEAAALMSHHRVDGLPVVDGTRVVGTIARVDVVRSVSLRPWAHD
jgi:CBS domain-containing protein